MNVRLALIQMQIVQGDPKTNLEKAEHYVAQAAKENADLVAFPEDFLTGPVGRDGEGLVDFEDKYAKLFSKFAQKNKIDIVAGSWIEGSRHGWRNVSHYIDCSGKIKGVYHKVNLWIPERTYLTAGNTTSVFHTRFGKVGLSICWDLAFPEFFRALVRRRGARLVFCPSYWVGKDAGIGQAKPYRVSRFVLAQLALLHLRGGCVLVDVTSFKTAPHMVMSEL